MLIVKYNKYRTCNIPYIDRLLILTLSLTVYPFSPSEKIQTVNFAQIFIATCIYLNLQE